MHPFFLQNYAFSPIFHINFYCLIFRTWHYCISCSHHKYLIRHHSSVFCFAVSDIFSVVFPSASFFFFVDTVTVSPFLTSPLKNRLRKHILHICLDSPFEWSCSVLLVIAFSKDIFLCMVGELKLNIHLCLDTVLKFL